MSLKRHISKELILSHVDDFNFNSINQLTDADVFVMDIWSDNFLENYDYDHEEYQKLRSDIIDYTRFYSYFDYSKNENYNRFKKLSNVFINLNNDPTWFDVSLALDILGIKIPDDKKGLFDYIVDICKKRIDENYG